MAIDLVSYEKKASKAVQAFWQTRDTAIAKQRESGKQDQGERGSVTAGKNMDGFVTLILDIVKANGLVNADIHKRRAVLTLPGFFRPTKLWDLLVIHRGILIAAIELKSQVGPSFGNNFNNRTEEAMGSALDVWTAFREGVFKNSSPWLGYLMVLEDCRRSSSSVAIHSPHFNVMSEFENSSYIKRYEIFSRKLVLERQYNAACFITSRRCDAQTGDFTIPDEQLSFNAFLVSMLSAVFAYRASKGEV